MARTKRTRSGRFTKQSRRRASKTGLNLMNTLEAYLLLDAVSRNVAGTGIVPFFTSTSGGGSSFVITFREVIDGLTGGKAGIWGPTATSAGIDATIGGVFGRNIKANWMPLAASMIGIPIGFKLAKKIGRPVLTRTRKMLKDAGLKGTVTV
jgi:hypothetical protein